MQNKKRKTFQTSEDMIGKYINRYIGSDAYPIGKIVGIKSKTTYVVQPIEAECKNFTQLEQDYDYIETGEKILIRLTTSNLERRYITNKPCKYIDPDF